METIIVHELRILALDGAVIDSLPSIQCSKNVSQWIMFITIFFIRLMFMTTPPKVPEKWVNLQLETSNYQQIGSRSRDPRKVTCKIFISTFKTGVKLFLKYPFFISAAISQIGMIWFCSSIGTIWFFFCKKKSSLDFIF